MIALEPIEPIAWVHVLSRELPAEFVVRCDRCGAVDVVRHVAAACDPAMLRRVHDSHAKCPKPGGAR